MAGLGTVSEVAAFLRQHPGWSSALHNVNPDDSSMNRSTLETLLRSGLYEHFLKVAHFVSSTDRSLMRYTLALCERDIILSFLRLFNAGRLQDFQIMLPEAFLGSSKIDFTKLSAARSYDQMLEAVRDTEVYASLARFAPDGNGVLNYTGIEVALMSHEYRIYFGAAKKRYSGSVKKTLVNALGSEIDVINIIRIMRLKKYFPSSMDTVFNYLLPFSYRLSQDFVRQLYTADDETAMLNLLKTSRYSKVFEPGSVAYIEEYYYRMLNKFNLRMLKHAAPSVYTAVAYLHLKQLELKNVINIIECVRYQVPPQNAAAYLVGVK